MVALRSSKQVVLCDFEENLKIYLWEKLIFFPIIFINSFFPLRNISNSKNKDSWIELVFKDEDFIELVSSEIPLDRNENFSDDHLLSSLLIKDFWNQLNKKNLQKKGSLLSKFKFKSINFY